MTSKLTSVWMMVLGTLVVACDAGEEARSGDAAVDGSVAADGGGDGDAADALPRVCDGDRALPTPTTTGGAVEGMWRIQWSCVDGCVLSHPGLTFTSQLDIQGASLRFSDADCPECMLTHQGTAPTAGCIDVPAGVDFSSQCRFSYRLCELGGRLEGRLTWKEPGVSEINWRLVGSR